DRYGTQSALSYTALGQLSSVTDPGGRGSLTFAYDPSSGLLISITDWSGRVVHYAYDTNTPPRLHSVTDRNNQVTTYAYNGSSPQLASITDANGHVAVTMTYDSQGRVATQKDALGLSTGRQTTFSYGTPDGQGNVTTTVTYPATSFDGSTPQQIDTYNSQGQITKHVMKPSASETLTETYAYSSSGFRSQVTDPRGNTTTFCYDIDYTGAAVAGSLGNQTRTVSPPPQSGAKPLVTLVKYDSKNNVIETVAPKGVNNGTSVTCSTNLTSVINASGLFVTDMTYDTTLGTELLTVSRKYTDSDTGAQTAVTRFAYGDAANPGLVTTVTSPRNNPTTLTYNSSGAQAGLLQSVKDPLNNTSSYVYDAVGRRTSLTDPLGHAWTFQYDNEDRLTQASAPPPTGTGSPLVTSATFDPVGNRLSLTDANGQITRYQYDVRDSLSEVDQSTTQNDPNADSSKIRTTYTYDNLGNLNRVLRAAGDANNERATDYTYDGLGRVRKETQYPSWPSTSSTLVTTTTYDANSNRLTMHDPNGVESDFSYDALNRFTGYSAVGTVGATYTYDADGNRLSMADNIGTTTYSYDELDRLLSVTSPSGAVVGYRYDLDGNRRKLIYPDNTAVSYVFDAASRMQSLTDWASRTTSYSYFADGLLQSQTNFNGTSSQFTYDNARRLTQVGNQQGASTISQHTYTLDSAGNRTQLAEQLAQVGGGTLAPTTTYSYDHLYRLLGDGTTTYTYDPVGNRLTAGSQSLSYDRADRLASLGCSVDGNGNITRLGCAGGQTASYDAANRLTNTHNLGNSVLASYTYDGDGKRISKSNSPGVYTVSYTYDVAGGLPVVLQDKVTGIGGPLGRKYVWGATGLAYSVDTNNAVLVSHTDGLGSIRALTDVSGTLVQTYRTDAYGVPTQTQGSATQRFQYTGELGDENGLVDLRARMYDPVLGRFLQRDSVFGFRGSPTSLNRFAYSVNNPTTYKDPSGRSVVQAAKDLCNAQGFSCDDLTHDMAAELLNGNATEVDWTDFSVFQNGSPIDWWLFALANISTGGDVTTIRISAKQFAHVLERHTVYGAGALADLGPAQGLRSFFADPQDVANLVRAAASAPSVPGKFAGTFTRTVESEAVVGWDRATRAATRIYTVVTDTADNLITAHPGRPN
ncbi:MAG TPA: RHS repeat-associated core domain-containing protein, partial [Chloroflexota bacterium]